jgi:iron complex outermembrane recepter protein
MTIPRLSTLAVLLGTASAFVLPSAALAQVADSEGDANEILVTATRDARNLQDVAMQVNVATGDALERLSIFDVKDIQQLAPGLDLNNNDPRKNTTTLRGISFDPDQGTSPAVEVYYNEIPADAQTVYTAIYDIAQIEVLRGPQGLLRGLSAPAGSITIATRKPNFDAVEGYAQASGTTRNGVNLQGGVTLPFSDKVAIRVAGLYDGNRVNHVRNITQGGKRGYNHTLSGRFTLGLRPSEDFSLYLTYQYLNSDARSFQQVIGTGNTPQRIYTETFGLPSIFIPPAFGGGPFPTDTAVRSGPSLEVGDYAAVTDGGYRLRNNTHIVNLGADYDLGAMALSFVGAYQHSKIVTNRDQDLGNAIPGYSQDSYVVVPGEFNTQELRLHSNNTEGLGWSISAFHYRRTGDVINDVHNDLFVYNTDPNGFVQAPLGPGGSFITVPNRLPLFVHVTVPVRTRTYSFAGNLRYFSGPLRIEAGLRYSIRKNNQTTQITTVGFQNSGPNEVIPPNLQRSTVKPVTGGANISYDISDDLTVYAAYGHSYRAPTTGVSLPQGITADLIRTRPEKTDSFEAGIKGKVLDRRLNYSVAGFYQKFDGYIRRFEGIYWVSPADPQGQGSFGFNYNGDAEIKGVEASLDGRVSDNWDIGLSASYAKARYKNALLPCNDYAGTGIPNQTGTPAITGSGNVSYCASSGRISETPDFGFNANTEVRFPTGNVTPFVAGLLTYRPGYFSQTVQYDYDDRVLLNMFVGVRGPDEKWSVTLFVRNLLDQNKITNISLGNAAINSILAGFGGGTYDSGYRAINAMNPREFGLTAAFKF